MAKISITQVKSRIGSTKIQKRNLDALGLHKLNRTVVHEDSPVIMGMIEKVRHLVVVEAAKGEPKAKVTPKATPAAVKEAAAETVVAEVAATKEAAPKAKPAAAKPKAAAPKAKPAAVKKAPAEKKEKKAEE